MRRNLVRALALICFPVPVPAAIVLPAAILLTVGLSSPYWVSLGVSWIIGGFGVSAGFVLGRLAVMRKLRHEQLEAEVEMIPHLLARTDEEDMPPFIRQALQAQLREAEEALARRHRR